MSLYTQEYTSYNAADEAAEEWSKSHPGHYYVSWVEGNAYTISTISDGEYDPYWCNGVLHYPEF